MRYDDYQYAPRTTIQNGIIILRIRIIVSILHHFIYKLHTIHRYKLYIDIFERDFGLCISFLETIFLLFFLRQVKGLVLIIIINLTR